MIKKLVLLLVLVSAAFAVNASQFNSVKDVVYVPYYPDLYPENLEAGDKDVLVELTLINFDRNTIYDVETELVSSFPFTVKDTDAVSRVDPNGRFTVRYLMDVSESVEPGEYLLLHKVYFVDKDGDSYYTTRTISISVDHAARLELSEVELFELLPGQASEGILWFENTGDLITDNIIVELKDYNTTALQILPTKKRITRINPGEIGGAPFLFTANKFAEPGGYPVTMLATFGSKNVTQSILVTIAGEATMDVIGFEYEEVVEPGTTNHLMVHLQNTGGAQLTSVHGKLTSDTGGIGVISDADLFIDGLGPGETYDLEYDIRVDKEVTAGVYSLDLALDSEELDHDQKITFEVKGVPKLQLAGVQADEEIIYTGTPFSLSVQLENIGTGDAKSVKVVLEDGDIQGVTTSYIGTVELDDTGTAIFDIRDNTAGKRKATALITFEDDYGTTMTKELPVEYFVTAVPFNILPFVFLIVVVGVGYWWWRRKKKQEEKIKKLVK